MRRILTIVAAVALFVAGCGDDDNPSADVAGPSEESTSEASGAGGPRFCDAYLDYLADSTPENLRAVEEAADDPQVREYAETIRSSPGVTALLAATLDLDDLARSRCQPEWTAGAQGAGDTAAAAQAFFDALVAGDRAGARNVASANAIATFVPWEPLEPDPEVGAPALVDVGGQSFSIVLGAASLVQCEVETGVVVACQMTG